MGVQKTVIGRSPEDFGAGTVEVEGNEVKIAGGTGALALGVPGNIYDNSPARIHTDVVTAEDFPGSAFAEIGSPVPNKGIIVNPREYALRGDLSTGKGSLAPSLTLPIGSTVSFMTFGHVVAFLAIAPSILESMESRIIVGQPPLFSTEATYKVGDIVDHEGFFMKCIEAVTTAGEWDDDKWRDLASTGHDPFYGGDDTELCVIEVNGFKSA